MDVVVGEKMATRGGALRTAGGINAAAPWRKTTSTRNRARARTRIASSAGTGTEELVTSSSRDLGPTKVAPIGIGAWSWGDALYWNDGWSAEKEGLARGAYDAYLELAEEDAWIDTAEVYGGIGGESERILGRFIRDSMTTGEAGIPLARPKIATKFAALPWRFSKGAVPDALRASLSRCKTESCDLYQLHWPGLWFNDEYLEGLEECVKQGLTKSVGVSNYSDKRLAEAHKRLKELGVPLASNQIHYNLLYRLPETNGVLEKCRELGVTVIAYSPLAQGILTSKYDEDNLPSGARSRIYNQEFMRKAKPLLELMKEIGENHGGKSSTQVALNWLLCNPDVTVIPGAKNREQVEDIMGAVGWQLDEGEVLELRKTALAVPPVRGFPAEDL
ncbi:oxidoreductase [Chloropicon primus]|uniref:Oxidoreductase n=2 Tax=Chloropicon primus TaxID=1764295 RepID=A0A5B8MG63_9CHLO|nr:oxidoreductase [Chloropicon primus]UPQ98622.1 oxidoreductase [Chloropicon primus]|eukprot:QDZ19413.1 oxidoreductase [Chloropicon primus]